MKIHPNSKKVVEQYVRIFAGEKFGKDILCTYKNNKNIPVALMFCYLEHKSIMFWRLRYVVERENLEYKGINTMYSNIQKMVGWILNATLKFNYKYSEELIIAINEKLVLLII